jgi:hypothetical protein
VAVGDQLAVPEQDVLDRRFEVGARLDLDARVAAAGFVLDLARELPLGRRVDDDAISVGRT